MDMGECKTAEFPRLVCGVLLGMTTLSGLLGPTITVGQVPPSMAEVSDYTGLLAAAAIGDATEIARLTEAGADLGIRDKRGRTPLHVAAFSAHHEAMRALVKAGADPNSLEIERYDIVTIAAVLNDVATLELALALGTSPGNVTSPYDGTALIAAAHLGHVEAVKTLIAAGAPLNHINNLGWTAVIEAIVLGDGGPRHLETLATLLDAGADVELVDRSGESPLSLARARGYGAMVDLLVAAGGR